MILALIEGVVIMVVAGAVLVVLVRAAGDALGGGRLAAEQRQELARLTELVEDLKDLAWDHREIDPDLATILLDKIRASERGRRQQP